MAATTSTGKYHPKGYNDGNHFFVEANVDTVLANTDTLDVVLPEGVDDDALPVSLTVWGPVSGTTRTIDTDIALTSHDSSTRKTRLTATGAVAVNSTVIIEYLSRLSGGE